MIDRDTAFLMSAMRRADTAKDETIYHRAIDELRNKFGHTYACQVLDKAIAEYDRQGGTR